MKFWWLAVLLTGCVVSDETETDPADDDVVHSDVSEEAPEYGSPDRYNPCLHPAGVMPDGVEIPVECYSGPPRHDDVENVEDPSDAISEPQQNFAQPAVEKGHSS